MWLNKLKAAIIEKDAVQLEKLLDETPKFETKEEIESVIYLFKAAIEVLEEGKKEINKNISHVKKNLEFLKSTQNSKPSQLDVKF